jgi:hypothetical protein
MKIAPALVLALATLGCANEVIPAPAHPAGDGEKLGAAPLLGPFATLGSGCSMALARTGAAAAACLEAPVAAPDAPFQIRLLHAENGGDPRFAGSGTYFFALGKDGAWFVSPNVLDHVDGAAGHSRLPAITPTKVSVTKKPALLVLTQLHDAISQMCNSCEGAARNEKKPVDARTIVVVCGEKEGKPVCTAPIVAADKAQVGLDEAGTLSVAAPGGPVKRYQVGF